MPEGSGPAQRTLRTHRTRPAPERIAALVELGLEKGNRSDLDHAFLVSESVSLPPDPAVDGFDPDRPRLHEENVREHLAAHPENRQWIIRSLRTAAEAFGIPLPGDPVDAAGELLTYLCRHVSFWEADAFPLEAMMQLASRYDWTFTTDAWSLREQLRREAAVVRRAWRMLLALARHSPLLVILNETTPTAYLTCILPRDAAVVDAAEGFHRKNPARILLYTGLKISSSEHRDSLKGMPEGEALETAMRLAQETGRRPVLVDFSRRRFPRSFLRVCRFACRTGRGILPVDKVREFCAGTGRDMPPPKSSRGLPVISGSPVLTLVDPWPVSDPEIIASLTPAEREAFCHSPRTKPWQDDRIGARTEMEADADGVYRVAATPWIVPALGGWMRTDHLFQSRLARFVRPALQNRFQTDPKPDPKMDPKMELICP